MGILFEKLKKKSDRPTHTGKTGPIPVKQGRVRGNKNIFKVGLTETFLLPTQDICLIKNTDYNIFTSL